MTHAVDLDQHPIDRSRCLSRIWNNARGGQCSQVPLAGNEFCSLHLKQAQGSGLTHGRIDGDPPSKKLAEFRRYQAALKDTAPALPIDDSAPIGAEERRKAESRARVASRVPDVRASSSSRPSPSSLVTMISSQLEAAAARRLVAFKQARDQAARARRLPTPSGPAKNAALVNVIPTRRPHETGGSMAPTRSAAQRPVPPAKARRAAAPPPEVTTLSPSSVVEGVVRRSACDARMRGLTHVLGDAWEHHSGLVAVLEERMPSSQEVLQSHSQQFMDHLQELYLWGMSVLGVQNFPTEPSKAIKKVLCEAACKLIKREVVLRKSADPDVREADKSQARSDLNIGPGLRESTLVSPLASLAQGSELARIPVKRRNPWGSGNLAKVQKTEGSEQDQLTEQLSEAFLELAELASTVAEEGGLRQVAPAPEEEAEELEDEEGPVELGQAEIEEEEAGVLGQATFAEEVAA